MNQYFIIFIILSTICFFQEKRNPHTKIPIWVMFIFAVLIGIRAEDIDLDYVSYLNAINDLSDYTKEPSFALIAKIANTYLGKFNAVGVFCVYSFMSIFMTFTAFNRFSVAPLISLVVFFSSFMILEECNAIRAGVATGFILLSMDYWKNKDLRTFIFIFCAVLFHYSYLILVPVFFLVDSTDKKMKYFLFSIPLAYVIYYTIDFSFIAPYVNILLGSKRVDINYQANLLNVFSTIIIFRILFFYYLYFRRSLFASVSPYFYIFLKLYAIGLFIVIAFANIPMLNMRLMNIFLCVELFLFPIFIKGHSKSAVPLSISICYCIFSLYIYVIKGEYLLDYSINAVLK